MKTSVISKNIAQVVVGIPAEGPFDYAVPPEMREVLAPGCRVKVSFGRKTVTGYVVGFTEKSAHPRLKPVLRVMDARPVLGGHMLELGEWLSRYYGCSLGEALETMLPFSVRKRQRLSFSLPESPPEVQTRPEQGTLIIEQNAQQLYQDVAQVVERCLEQNRSVIILAPDAWTAEDIQKSLSFRIEKDVLRYDLKTAKKQIEVWTALRSGRAHVVVGLRSAVFAPVRDLGAMIILHEDQYGYQEDQTPHYYAVRVSRERCSREGAHLYLTAAAPRVETWFAVERGELKLNILREDTQPGTINALDLTNYKPRRGSSLAYPALQEAQRTLEAGGRVVIFYNRRGFSRVIHCRECASSLRCPRCHVPLTYIYKDRKFVCPACASAQEPVDKCPDCGKAYEHYGEGIERLESNLARFFPLSRIRCFDAGTSRFPVDAQVLVATQAAVSRLVPGQWQCAVILDADAMLERFDYRAHQKMFSLLMRFRTAVNGKIFVQTRQPLHPVIQSARTGSLEKFYRGEIKTREDLQLPPFAHSLMIALRGKREERVAGQAEVIYQKLDQDSGVLFEVLAPQPDFQAKLRDQYRYIIMAKSQDVESAVRRARQVVSTVSRRSGVTVTLQVDV
ncbi:MAG: primosomal protein N' [Candidatus Omnitrophota bacterium]